MSALPPKADIGSASRNVRFVPKADIAADRLNVRFTPIADIADAMRNVRFVPKADIGASLNDFVCACEQRGRNCEAERLSSLEIDYQLVLHRSLYWKVGWLLALEDAIEPLLGPT